MDNYYTPTVKEFHVGFEYEIFEKEEYNPNWSYLVSPDTEGSWHKDTFPSKIYGYSLNKILERETRVKYLDEQDILDSGWAKDRGRFILIKNNMEHICNLIRHFKEGKEYFHYFQPHVNVDDNTIGHSSMGFLIKNKSELKKLMEQLNIN